MKKYTDIFKKSEKKFTIKKQYEFFNSLSKILKVSYSLTDALELIDCGDDEFIRNLKTDIKNGESMQDALKNSGKFSNLTHSVVKVGEETGRLDGSFEKLSAYLEIVNDTKRQLKKALSYPAFLLIAIILLLIYINYSFIPSVNRIYSGNAAQLPAVTSTIAEFSDFSVSYPWQTPLLIFSIVGVTAIFLLTYFSGKSVFEMNIPVFSPLAKDCMLSFVLWTYYVLISSGIDVLKATDILKSEVKNDFLSKKLSSFYIHVNEGSCITEALEKIQFKDEKIRYLIDIGEKTGTMEQSLKTLSEIYFKSLTDKITRLSKSAEPIMVLIMALVIGFVVTFIVLPLIFVNYSSL